MVVLEGNTMSMLTMGNNQYLQPDYLSPNPVTVSFMTTFLIYFIWKNSYFGYFFLF